MNTFQALPSELKTLKKINLQFIKMYSSFRLLYGIILLLGTKKKYTYVYNTNIQTLLNLYLT